MDGAKVVRVNVAPGDAVTEGQTLIVVESMKMELEIKAKGAGVITYKADTGSSVAAGQTIAVVR